MPAPTQPPDVGPRTPAAVAASALVRARFFDVRRYEDVLRAGPDPEGVHDLRVAVRRLRAALKLFGGEQEAALALGAEAKRLQDALGALRDLQLRQAWLEHLREADAPCAAGASTWIDSLPAARVAAEGRLEAALRHWHQASAGVVPEALVEEVAGRFGHPDQRKPLRSALRRLERRLDAVEGDVPEAAAHEARIAAKKARYLAELLVPSGPELLEPVRQAMTSFQDLAGELHDLDVRRHEVEKRRADDPGEATRLVPIEQRLGAERQRVAGDLLATADRWRVEELLRKLRGLLK